MRTKNVIILVIIAVIIVIAGIAAYTMLPSTPEYKNITMGGITMEVPDNNITVTNRTDLYQIYNDTENNITIYTFDSEDSNLGDLSEMTDFAMARETSQVGGSPVTKDNVSFNESNSTGVCSYVGNYTHKNILVITHDEDQMVHILETMKLAENTTNSTLNNTNNTTTDTAQVATTQKTSKSASHQVASKTSKDDDPNSGSGETYNPPEESDEDTQSDSVPNDYYEY